MSEFYAYVHARPDGSVFYVGKGTLARSKDLRRNRYHQNVVAKHGAENVLVGRIECSSEQVAFELEKGLIKCLRRSGVKLTNMTDGGDGVAGNDKSYMQTQEYRSALSTALSGKRLSAEHKAKISANMAARFASPEARIAHGSIMKVALSNPEARENIAAAHRGLKMSDETKTAMSAAAKRRWEAIRRMSPPKPPKIVKSRFGHVVSAETKAKISSSLKGRLRSVEHCANIKKTAVVRSDGVVYESIHAAAKATGACASNIHHVLTGKHKSAGGYGWTAVKQQSEVQR